MKREMEGEAGSKEGGGKEELERVGWVDGEG